MNTKLQKIIFSSFALVLSFIFKIEIVKNLLQILSCFVLLEDNIRGMINSIQKKKLFNIHMLLILMSISYFVLDQTIILLEFLIFYELNDYLLDILLDKKEKKTLSLFHKEKETVLLKTVSGYVNVFWENVKEGDILYIKDNGIVLTESILLSDKATYHSMFDKEDLFLQKGDMVPSGSVIEEDVFVKVTNTYQTSYYRQMITRLENIDENETLIFSDTIETKYNKFLFVISLFISFVSILYFKKDITKVVFTLFGALSLLVDSGFIRLVHSTYFNDLMSILKQSICFTKKNILEEISKIKIALFSKTGVLTNGNLILSKIIPVYQTKEEVLKIAAYIEYNSNHPMAKAILNQYKDEIITEKIYQVEDIKGMGRKANIEGKEVYIGNNLLFDEANITYPKVSFSSLSCMLAIDHTYVASFVFEDYLKEDSYLLASLLREEGMKKVVLLSSSETENIKKIGSYLSMNESYASLTLEDKEEVLKMYKKEEKTMYIDAFKMEERLKNNTDISVLCTPLNNNKADVILINSNLKQLIFLKKQANFLDKQFQVLVIGYLLMKLLLFILLFTNVLTMQYSMLFLLIFNLIAILFLFKTSRG